MAAFKTMLFAFVVLAAIACLAYADHGGDSYTSVHKEHAGKYDYKIDHSKHGHFSGHAYPHGYGGFGAGH